MGLTQELAELSENLKIVAARVAEDALLDVAVSFVGIVVEVLQLTLGRIVIVDIVLQLFTIILQCSADIDSQG